MESQIVIIGISFYIKKILHMPMTGLYKTLLPCFIEIPVFNGNSVNHDQMPHSVASDLDLHSLPVPLLWDAMLSTLSL